MGVPPRVGEAAAAHRLGAAVSAAEGDRRTITRRWALRAVGVLVVLSLIVLGKWSGGGAPFPVWPVAALVFGSVFLVDRFGGRTGVTLHLFERGAVLDRSVRAGVRVVALQDLAPTLRRQGTAHSGGRWVLTVRVAERAVFTCTGDEAVRLSDVIAAAVLAEWSRPRQSG
jgi:hypothetical protein